MSGERKFPAWESEDGTGCRRSISTGQLAQEAGSLLWQAVALSNPTACNRAFAVMLLIGSFALGFAGAVNV